ncbi:MAG: YdcF family protein [Candidatus Saccharibacteria bacterium]|nr:YdcF family protein [Candidatus Saccharibacteria bacterium]
MLVSNILALVFTIITLIGCIFYIFRASKKTMYSYKIMLVVGLIIFLGSTIILLASQLSNLIEIQTEVGDLGPEILYMSFLGLFSEVSYLVFPIAIILSGLLMLGSIVVIYREGRNFNNLLGIFIGVCALVAIALDINLDNILINFLDITTREDFHLVIFLENIVDITLVYFECMLVASFVCTIKAGRHRPKLEQDYMIILGCYPGKDLNLTPFLRGRVERALSFDREQQKLGGKKLIFVVSGGQGGDEVISEADAMAKYLEMKKIPRGRILVENRSINTWQNMRYSKKAILKNLSKKSINSLEDVKIAFATSDYHVFRSGIIANKNGLKVEGVGSKTRWYFYINAAVREFVANIVSEWRVHLLNVLVLNLIMGGLIALSLVFEIVW